MPKPGVSAFIRQHIDQTLSDAGYIRDKRLYQRQNSERATAFVEFLPSAGVVPPSFTVRAGLALPKNDSQRSGTEPVAPHGSAHMVWGFDLLPPPDCSAARFDSETVHTHDWSFDGATPTDEDHVGVELSAALASVALPLLQQALHGERNVDKLTVAGIYTLSWLEPFIPPQSAAEAVDPWATGLF